MPNKIDAFPTRTRAAKYDFSEVFDGSIYEMIEGVDFTVKPASFRTALYSAAKAQNVSINTLMTVRDGKTVFTVQKTDAPRKTRAPRKPAAKKATAKKA